MESELNTIWRSGIKIETLHDALRGCFGCFRHSHVDSEHSQAGHGLPALEKSVHATEFIDYTCEYWWYERTLSSAQI